MPKIMQFSGFEISQPFLIFYCNYKFIALKLEFSQRLRQLQKF